MSRPPPVPPDNRSDKGGGSPGSPNGPDDSVRNDRDRNLSSQGRQGNIRQNTHNQGHQQDR